MRFFITDVFGNKKYSGNQLATFLDYGKLSTEEMQKIAREINFSETTFITGKRSAEGSFPVRIFTPNSEIDFAGHPTLGTAFIIKNNLENTGEKEIFLDFPVGRIPVRVTNDIYWMKQKQPEFGKEISTSVVSRLIGVAESAINKEFPVLETSTGLAFTIVPLNSMKALKEARIDLQEYNKFIQISGAKGIMVFSTEAYENKQDISSRVFVNYLGIPEDPATGSANGCLAAYLLKTNFFGQSHLDLTVAQGYEIGRPSEIMISANKTHSLFDINVGGKVHYIASGEWETG